MTTNRDFESVFESSLISRLPKIKVLDGILTIFLLSSGYLQLWILEKWNKTLILTICVFIFKIASYVHVKKSMQEDDTCLWSLPHPPSLPKAWHGRCLSQLGKNIYRKQSKHKLVLRQNTKMKTRNEFPFSEMILVSCFSTRDNNIISDNNNNSNSNNNVSICLMMRVRVC